MADAQDQVSAPRDSTAAQQMSCRHGGMHAFERARCNRRCRLIATRVDLQSLRLQRVWLGNDIQTVRGSRNGHRLNEA